MEVKELKHCMPRGKKMSTARQQYRWCTFVVDVLLCHFVAPVDGAMLLIDLWIKYIYRT